MLPVKWNTRKAYAFSVLLTSSTVLVLLISHISTAAADVISQPTSSLVFLHNRFYDPEISRLISPDPKDQSPSAYVNRYAYTNNSPSTFTDRYGMDAYDDFINQVKAQPSLYTMMNNPMNGLRDRIQLGINIKGITRFGKMLESASMHNYGGYSRKTVGNIMDINDALYHLEDTLDDYARELIALESGEGDPRKAAIIEAKFRKKGTLFIDRVNNLMANNPELAPILGVMRQEPPITPPQPKGLPPGKGGGAPPHGSTGIGPDDLLPGEPGGGKILKYFRGGLGGIIIAVVVENVVNPDTTSAATHTFDPQTYNNALARLSGHSPVLPPYLFPPNDPLGEAQCYGQVHAAC